MSQLRHPEYEGALGRVIARHRERQGYTAIQLARLMGYNAKQTHDTRFGKIERGESDFSAPALFRLAELLGPDFVDDVADALFAAARRGLERRREGQLAQAQQLTNEIRERQRKPRPSFDEAPSPEVHTA